jgi:DNA-binding NarL/FixJ family response regulator
MQQALRTSLAACLPLVVLSSAGDGLTALNQVMAQHPALVVIDANLLPEESEALLVAIKAASAPPRCLVLVHSSQHEARMIAAGADAVILHDVSAGELQSVVARLTEVEK